METGTLLGLGALAVSAAGALNSMRKQKVEERSATHAELERLNQTLRDEIDRINKRHTDGEVECQRQIAKCRADLEAEREKRRMLQELFNEQAERISELERRRDKGTRTRAGDATG